MIWVSADFINNSERLLDDLEDPIPPSLRYEVNEFFHSLPKTRLEIRIPFGIIGEINDPWAAFQEIQGQAAPVAAVLTVVTVITHHETMPGRYG